MTEKTKRSNASVQSRLRSVVMMTLVGVLLLGIAGAIGAIALSITRRYAEPEDALAKYPLQRELRWHESPDNLTKFSDFRVVQRIERDDINAVHFVLLWFERRDGTKMECVGGLLVGEAQDIFGGWQELRYSRGGCHSFGGRGGVGGYSFWESSAWEIPHYYYFAYHGATTEHETVEYVLTDGTVERATPINGSIGLVIRRDEPFQIVIENVYDQDGELLYSHNHHS